MICSFSEYSVDIFECIALNLIEDEILVEFWSG